MIHRLIDWALWGAAAGAVKAGAKLAPQRALDVFPSHALYGARPWWHLDVHRQAPGWLFMEVGSWTVEVAWRTRGQMAAARHERAL
jgi:hypothetical protein